MADSDSQDKQKVTRNRYILFLLLLIMLVGISSCIVGYILGQRAVIQKGGEMIDTIVIEPEETEPVNIALSGIVRYTNGIPVPNKWVEIHSNPRRTKTNEKGYFFFQQIESGNHELFVLDENGELLTSCQVEIITKSNLATIQIQYKNELGYVIEIPVESILLEVDVKIQEQNESKNQKLELDSVTVIRKDGTMVTSESTTRPEGDKTLTTERNNVVYDDGTILLPDGRVLLNDGTLIDMDGNVIYPDGTVEKSENIVYTKNDATILPDGIIYTPGGHVINRNDTNISPSERESTSAPMVTESVTTSVSQKETTSSIYDDSEESTTEGSQNSGEESTTEGSHDSGEESTTEGSQNSGEESTTEDSQNSGEENTTENNKDNVHSGQNKVTIISENKAWTQNTNVNLFAGIDKLYPGVKGSYTFMVSNNCSYPVKFSLQIVDSHDSGIPFSFTLKDRTGNIVTPFNEILDAGEHKTYTLYWQWPYEGGHDMQDTSIGNDNDSFHIVVITIRAEEVID